MLMRGNGYTIEMKIYKGLSFAVIIEDDDNQGVSVTNNIEGILQAFKFEDKFQLEGCVYRDSTGTWDGFDGENFVLLGLSSDTDIDRVIGTYILKDRVFKDRKITG